MAYQIGVVPKFPARVNAGVGIGIEKQNGVYTFRADYETVAPGTVTDPGNAYVLVQQPDGSYIKVPVAAVGGEGLAGTDSVIDFGAVGDGIADDTGAFNNALATGQALFVPSGHTYLITDTLNFTDGAQLIGAAGQPIMKMVNAAKTKLLNLVGRVEAGFSNLRLDCNGISTSADSCFADLTGASFCRIRDNYFDHPSGTFGVIQSDGKQNDTVGNVFDNPTNSCIALTTAAASYNNVLFNRQFHTGWGPGVIGVGGGFLVDVFGGANRNLIQGNKKFGGLTEVVGVRLGSWGNQLLGNTLEYNGDTGISLSGHDNVCSGNIIVGAKGSGITCWGKNNLVSGNYCINNGQGGAGAGILIQPGFGGTGQFNSIVDNMMDDTQSPRTQTYGVYCYYNNNYTPWAAGVGSATITTTWGYYCVNGNNVYRYVSGATTGAPGPTHVSGSVADGGGVVWTFMDTFTGAPDVRYNFVANNRNIRSLTGEYFDTGNWLYNSLSGYERAPSDMFDIRGVLQATRVRSAVALVIADDAVGDFGDVSPLNVNAAFITCAGGSSNQTFFRCRTSASPISAYTFGVNTLMDFVTTNVTGTSGVDTHVTVSCTSGHLKIENRTGGSLTVELMVIGS